MAFELEIVEISVQLQDLLLIRWSIGYLNQSHLCSCSTHPILVSTQIPSIKDAGDGDQESVFLSRTIYPNKIRELSSLQKHLQRHFAFKT